MVIDLKPFVGKKTVCIYGFPTSGKTSAQRCFRFLNHEAKAALGIDPSVHFDFTDTDEYFGVFKMHEQTRNKREEITNMMWKSLRLATSLNIQEGHLSVIFTNFNHCYDGGSYDDLNFVGGFVPANEEAVRKSLKARQPQEYEQEIGRYLEWYQKAMESPLAKYLQERRLLIRMQPDEHMLDYLAFGDVTIPFVDVHIRPDELPNHKTQKDVVL